MSLTSWLRENLFDRALGRLARRAAAAARPPSLLAHLLPYLLRSRAAEPDAPAHVSRASRGGRELLVAGTAPVELEASYAEWVAPLARLPRGATPEEFRRAAEALPGYDPDGRLFFPADAYLGALRAACGPAAELAHRCRATRQPSLELLRTLAAATPPPAEDEDEGADDGADGDAVLLVRARAGVPADDPRT